MSSTRIMGMDYGHVRIGIALSDPSHTIARPLGVIVNNANTFDEINKIIRKESVSLIVLGLPLNLSGEYTQKTREVKAFAEKLAQKTSLPIEFMDERYTSAEAMEVARQYGMNERQARGKLDKIAAALILSQFLKKKRKPNK